MAGRRSRHGLHTLKVAVKTRGVRGLDRRCAGAKALIEFRAALVRDLGGEEHLSSQRRALLDVVVRTKLFVDHLDSFLMQQDCLVNRRKKAILPVLRERTQLADSLVRLLGQLGLERVPKAVPSLQEYLRRKEAEQPSQEQQRDEEPAEIDDAETPEVHE